MPPPRSPFSPVRRSSTEDSACRDRRLDLPPASELSPQKMELLNKKLEEAKQSQQEAEPEPKDQESKDRREESARSSLARSEERSESPLPDTALRPTQKASAEGLYCCFWGTQKCRKFLQSWWAYKQHLQCKHSFSRRKAHLFASEQWRELQQKFTQAQDPQPEPRVRLTSVAKDTRKPSEPLGPPPARPAKALRSEAGSDETRSQQAASSSAGPSAEGMQLMKDMWSEVAQLVFREGGKGN